MSAGYDATVRVKQEAIIQKKKCLRHFSAMLRRLLSTKVSRSLQHAEKAENGAKTASSRQDATDKAAEKAAANSWSHFAAFRSMDDYVDVTLIQYNKAEDDGDIDAKP
ncbi:hypothetical protein PHYPSEUDO_006636 [Phytophthora pseudosyringae]|uniref:Uncharacterized protein n=1 Tax=Phytophthora pseudosyringae TaxID=221518 RepID=A0A8T1WER3_9STRA|nr:hypothetical protein PHYPSEUDO_006636 [Phytophthora pseudosyringae]